MFVCPGCGNGSLEIVESVDLERGGSLDEVAVQRVECAGCGFLGGAVYEESRRGRLGAESIGHYGYRLDGDEYAALGQRMRSLPTAGDWPGLHVFLALRHGDPFTLRLA